MDIEFTPGQRAFVERRIGSHQRRGICRIIGTHEPNYLLLTAPVAEGAAMLMQEGTRSIVRYVVQGNMIGFWATVVRTLAEPFGMVILELPEEHEQMLLRKAERITCNLPVDLHLTHASSASEVGIAETETEKPALDCVQGIIIDLAQGGCQVALSLVSPGGRSPLEETSPGITDTAGYFEVKRYDPEFLQDCFKQSLQLSLDFSLPAPIESEYRSVPGEVCWAKVSQGYFFMGISFLGETEALGSQVERLVRHQMTFFTQRIRPVH